MTNGSGIFFRRIKTPSVASAIKIVGTSTIARRARTKPAPAMAPVAAAVTPSTKALRLRFLAKRRKYGAGMTVNKKQGRKVPDRGHDRAGQPSDEVADEPDRDDDRPRGDHRHGDRVQKLLVRQPVVFGHHPSLKEGDDRQAAAEHEGSRGGEAPAHRPQGGGRGGTRESGAQPGGQGSHDQHRCCPAGRRLHAHRQHATGDEEQEDFGFRPGGDERRHGEQSPEQRIFFQGQPGELEGAARDDRDHRRADSVEGALQPGQPAKAHVDRRESEDHQERGHHQGEADQRRSQHPAAYPAHVDRQLGGQRAGGELGQRESFDVVLLRNPPAVFDEVALHVAGERDRPSEAEGPQAQEIQRKVAHRAGDERGFEARVRIYLRVSTIAACTVQP